MNTGGTPVTRGPWGLRFGWVAAPTIVVVGSVLALLYRGDPKPPRASEPIHGPSANGRIAFVDLAPGYVAPTVGGQIPDTDIFTMEWDGTGVRQVTHGRDTDHSPSWSPDGSRIAFTRGWQDGPWNVFVANADGSGVRQITFCRFAGCVQELAWSPLGDEIAYVRGLDIYLIHPDGSDNHLLYRCGCSGIEIAWSPDASRIAFTGHDRRYRGLLFVLDTKSRSAVRLDRCETNPCRHGDRDRHPSWSPDGDTIAFSREANTWLVGSDGTGLRKLTSCPMKGDAPARCSRELPTWSPDGTRILFERWDDGIFVMNADATGSVNLRTSGFGADWLGVAPAASSARTTGETDSHANGLIAFSDIAPGAVEQRCAGCFSNTDIYVMNPDGSGVRPLTSGPDSDVAPVWSPDGTRLLFLRGDSPVDLQLWKANADGSNRRQLTYCGSTACVHGATWSIDGRSITYWTQESAHVINADGAGDRVVCLFGQGCPHATTSPDGRSIAYATSTGPSVRLVVAAADGAAPRVVATCASNKCVNAGEGPSDPAWSPDGRWIAFYREGNVWLVRPDGSGLERITDCTFDKRPGCLFSDPTWSPDGSEILFWRQSGIYMMDRDGSNVRKLRASGFLGSWQAV